MADRHPHGIAVHLDAELAAAAHRLMCRHEPRLEVIEYVSSVTDTEYLETTRSGDYDGLMGHCRQVIRGG